MTYDEAFTRIINHEGRFQNDPEDRGNWTTGTVGSGDNNGTKFGISAMSYPHLDIRSLTLTDAKAIYFRDYWQRMKGEELHNALAYQLFDAAINHGVGNAIRMLQRAVGVLDDGLIGSKTLEAVEKMGTDNVLKFFTAERIEFFTQISTFDRYGRGWMRRVSENLRHAADDYDAPWHKQVELL